MQRLLERIRLQAASPARQRQADTTDLVHSIQLHLQRLLNTRQGNVPLDPEYGVPDFTEAMSHLPDSRHSMEQALKKVIQRFEPRLRGVRVRLIQQDDDPLSLNFQITARLAEDPRSEPLTFESQMDPGGHIVVR